MSWFTSLLGSKTKSHKQEPTAFTLRQGINQMLKAVSTKTNPIDMHFLLQSIVGEAYKLRKEEKYRKICIEYSEKHLQEFPSLAPDLREDMGGISPRVTTFQHYATILTEDEEYEKAISICEKAIEYGLLDNTASGFEGRIARIRKKAEKGNA